MTHFPQCSISARPGPVRPDGPGFFDFAGHGLRLRADLQSGLLTGVGSPGFSISPVPPTPGFSADLLPACTGVARTHASWHGGPCFLSGTEVTRGA